MKVPTALQIINGDTVGLLTLTDKIVAHAFNPNIEPQRRGNPLGQFGGRGVGNNFSLVKQQ